MRSLIVGVVGFGVGTSVLNFISEEKHRTATDLIRFKSYRDNFVKTQEEHKDSFDPNSRHHQVYQRRNEIELRLLHDRIEYLNEWLSSNILYQITHPQLPFHKALGEIEYNARQKSGYDSC